MHIKAEKPILGQEESMCLATGFLPYIPLHFTWILSFHWRCLISPDSTFLTKKGMAYILLYT
jgi:hypothetical protein